MRRDWSSLVGRRTEDLPALTEPAQQLLEHFEQVMRDQRWEASRRYANLRTLTVLVTWLGADAPIAEADVHALAGLDGYMTAKRVCSFLHTRDLLAPDPNRHQDRNQQWIEQQITRFPRQIAAEVRQWVLVLRGEGRWEHASLGYGSIRRYLTALQPVLEDWIRQGVSSLREITGEQVAQAIGARRGNAARAVHNAVRSWFAP